MKNNTSAKSRATGKSTTPIKKKEDVPKSKDERIDQDFPGFPHPPSKESTIKKPQKNR